MFVDEVVLRVASGLDIASLSHARQRHQECNGITTTELTMKKVSRAMSRALEARCEMRPPSRVNDTHTLVRAQPECFRVQCVAARPVPSACAVWPYRQRHRMF